MVILLLGWGNSLAALSFFFSSLSTSRRMVFSIGIPILLIGNSCSLGIIESFYSCKQTPSLFYYLYPQFALARGLYMILQSMHSCNFFDSWNTEFAILVSSLFVMPPIYVLLSLYIDCVRTGKYGVLEHPLFFLSWLRDKLKTTRKSMAISEPDTGLSDVESNTEAQIRLLEPEEVLNVRNLSKAFDGFRKAPKRVVNDVSFRVNRGECFALLGKNGAGKSTIISMLIGLIPPSSGTATIAGDDITSNIDETHFHTSICPQHNLLWNDLSVEEHFLFYARLKGVLEEQAYVSDVLVTFGLSDVRNTAIAELSVGSQRKVSLAIALIGNSTITFLDEPTTELDDVTRRKMWNIIEKTKKDRALILTTHDMSEAAVLADRVCLLVDGRTQYLDSFDQLKKKFHLFHRYSLKILYHKQHKRQARRTVSRIFGSSATLVSEMKGCLKFEIRNKKRRPSKRINEKNRLEDYYADSVGGSGQHESMIQLWVAFQDLEEAKEKSASGIVDFSLAQTGLEEIFQKMVQQKEQSLASNH